MKSSNMNARTAVSGSTEFPWKWSLSELEKRPKHGHTVFSCFSCGGGSSMGYKLAGFDVVGNCEIDPDIDEGVQSEPSSKIQLPDGYPGFP